MLGPWPAPPAYRSFNGTYRRQAPTNELARLCVTLGRRAGWRTAGAADPAAESAGLSTHHRRAHGPHTSPCQHPTPCRQVDSWHRWAEDPCLRPRQPAPAAPVCFSLCSAHPGPPLTRRGRRIMPKHPSSLRLSTTREAGGRWLYGCVCAYCPRIPHDARRGPLCPSV